MNKGGLAGVFAGVGAFGGLWVRATTSDAGCRGVLIAGRARLFRFEQAHNVASHRQGGNRPHARGQHEGQGSESGVYQHPHRAANAPSPSVPCVVQPPAAFPVARLPCGPNNQARFPR
jgi:hypothetical protein